MSPQTDPHYELLARIDERTENMQRDIDTIINGKAGACQFHAAQISSLRTKINWLWGVFITLTAGVIGAFLSLLTGGHK